LGLNREQFIALLESGKYEKIEGDLYRGISIKSGKGEVCAIGAAIKETGNEHKAPARGFNYFPEQLVKDLDISPAFERLIFTTNDKNIGDNWKAVVELLRKEWNIPYSENINLYEAEALLNSYYSLDFYEPEVQKEDFGYNL
jgi:hypothetical protein